MESKLILLLEEVKRGSPGVEIVWFQIMRGTVFPHDVITWDLMMEAQRARWVATD